MFEHSLLDTDRTDRTKKPATIAASFLMQSVALGILIAIPLVYTDALPQRALMQLLMMPPAQQKAPAAIPLPAAVPIVAMRARPAFVQPDIIPRGVPQVREDPLPPSMFVADTPGHSAVAIESTSALASVPEFIVPPPPATDEAAPAQIGGDVMAAKLLCRVQPNYPELAIRVRVQGTVVLQALISREGRIVNLRAVSGHPLLVSAALEAVRQWCYEPTRLNGVPVEVETTV